MERDAKRLGRPGLVHQEWLELHKKEAAFRAASQFQITANDGTSRDEYVKMRHERDASLPVPALLLPAIQVNIRAGRLPEPDSNGTVYLRIPVDRF